jgi:hypothetical protein
LSCWPQQLASCCNKPDETNATVTSKNPLFPLLPNSTSHAMMTHTS